MQYTGALGPDLEKAGPPASLIARLHAEIYPSVRSENPVLISSRTEIKYGRRGSGLATWIGKSCFDLNFARPTEIDPGSPEDIAIQLTEGWILGSSPTVRRH